ncbi:MAG TPA: DNA polymerase III subunit delta' [Caldilineae bacterium]|nr:DNA polymerase III subunit delta' [Caldilineae bacterium]
MTREASQLAWPVIGHEWAVRLLAQTLRHGRLSHAYLFVGPPGVGKTTLARALAQAMLCSQEDPASRPCGACRACQLVRQDRHPDVRLVAPPGPDRALSIEQIRELQREASLSPMEGRSKVFIVRELDRATPQAANALLKTLEEPPPHVTLLLTAVQREALLPTVVSRCQVLALRPLSIAVVEEALRERWEVAPEQAALLARLSGGCLGVAVAALEDEDVGARRQQAIERMMHALEADRVTRLELAEQLSQEPEAVREIVSLWLGWWRDVMLIQSGCDDRIVNIDQRDVLQRAARYWAHERVREIVQGLRDTLEYMEANVNTRLALETLLLSLPYAPSRQA